MNNLLPPIQTNVIFCFSLAISSVMSECYFKLNIYITNSGKQNVSLTRELMMLGGRKLDSVQKWHETNSAQNRLSLSKLKQT